MALNFAKICLADLLGTGQVNCDKVLGIIEKIILVKKGWSIDVQTDTFNQALVQEAMQCEDMIVFRPHIGIEAQGTETQYVQTNLGLNRKTRDRIYGYRFTYAGSNCYSAALKALSSLGWDVLFVDIDGVIGGQLTTDGKFKGFPASLVEHDGRQMFDGTNDANEFLRIEFTLSATQAIETRMELLNPEADVDMTNLNGLIGVSFISTATPITASPFEVSVTESCNSNESATDLESKIKVFDLNGVEIPSTVTVTPNGYSIDMGAYTGSGIVRLWDDTVSKSIVFTDAGQGYKSSNTVNFTL